MKHRTSQILYAYWNDVRRGRLAPRRFDIEPARIASILAETMILERLDNQTYRFRLAGTRIGEQLNSELRGQNFLDLWAKDDQAVLMPALTQISEQGGVAVLEFEVSGETGQTAAFEAVLLPLVHTRDVIDRFLGALSCANAPAWLGTQRLKQLRLTDIHIVWPDGRPHAAAQRMEPPPVLRAEASLGRIVRQDRRQFRVLDGGRAGTRTER